jgi:hypothetical protein
MSVRESDPKVPYVDPETAAMLRERERCAKVVDSYACTGHQAKTCISARCCEFREIAAKIRSGK